MRILITNNTLGARAGSEMYVRDLALALMKRGHLPVAYSTVLGSVAEELQKATIPVIDDLEALSSPPDIIHGQHHLDALTAMLHFPQTPALFVCHGWLPWEELPPAFPSIARYVAVDELCRERLLTTPGTAGKDIQVIYNFVDLERFRCRAPLPAKPRSALIFSNYAADSPSLAAIRKACQRFGIERVEVVGAGTGNAVAEPESLLGDYDVVFAKARCALEAMAVGCAVIVADYSGLGGMVTTRNVAALRGLNFGVRTLQNATISEESVLSELQHYDHHDARQVSLWIRQEADMSVAVSRWIDIYQQVVAEWPVPDERRMATAQLAAAAAYLRRLAPVIKTRHEAEIQARLAAHQLQDCTARLAAAESRAARLEAELAAVHGSRAWAAITRYRRLRACLKKI